MTKTSEQSFEESLAELDGLARRLEAGDLGLDAALAAFERGVGIARRLHEILDAAEQRVEVLTRDGAAVLAADPRADD